MEPVRMECDGIFSGISLLKAKSKGKTFFAQPSKPLWIRGEVDFYICCRVECIHPLYNGSPIRRCRSGPIGKSGYV